MAGEFIELDLAYVAGFFDGEGNINIKKGRNKNILKYSLSVVITNTDQPVIEYIQSLLGGVLHTTKFYSNPVKRKERYDLIWCSTSAQRVLKLLLPYLRVKETQAKLAVTFQDMLEEKVDRNRPLTQLELDVREILHQSSKQLVNRGGK